MAKINKKYVCDHCDNESFINFLLCPKCRTGTSKEVIVQKEKTIQSKFSLNDKKNKESLQDNSIYVNKKIFKAKDISKSKFQQRISTGMKHFDIILGGNDNNIGIFPNSMVLIGGEPGIGKSTILTQVIDYIQENNNTMKCAYISAEENKEQIKNRVERLKCKGNFDIDSENNLYQIMTDFSEHDFLILDSINTIYIPNAGVVGGVSQIKESVTTLMNWAKKEKKTIFIVGQITSDGDIAGPQFLEHMVDTVLFFDNYDNNAVYRVIRSFKNRYGEANEIAIFKMRSNGLNEIDNPSLIFVDTKKEKEGATLSIITEGKIPMFVETQALIVSTNSEKTITQSIGYDQKRIFQINAILQKFLKQNFYNKNIFISLTGGIKVKQTSIDLSIARSILSSTLNKKIHNYVFIGELGLTGDIIKAPYEEELIKQSKKFGFNNIISNSTGYKHIKDVYDKLFS